MKAKGLVLLLASSLLWGCATRIPCPVCPDCPPGPTPEVPGKVKPPKKPKVEVVESATVWTANLGWMDNNFFEDGYKIERSIDDGVTWAQIGTTLADTQNFTDAGPLTLGTTYCWRVTVYNAFSTATSPKVCAQVLPPALAPVDALNVTIVPPS